MRVKLLLVLSKALGIWRRRLAKEVKVISGLSLGYEVVELITKMETPWGRLKTKNLMTTQSDHPCQIINRRQVSCLVRQFWLNHLNAHFKYLLFVYRRFNSQTVCISARICPISVLPRGVGSEADLPEPLCFHSPAVAPSITSGYHSALVQNSLT